jgi:hypothetical protein
MKPYFSIRQGVAVLALLLFPFAIEQSPAANASPQSEEASKFRAFLADD